MGTTGALPAQRRVFTVAVPVAGVLVLVLTLLLSDLVGPAVGDG